MVGGVRGLGSAATPMRLVSPAPVLVNRAPSQPPQGPPAPPPPSIYSQPTPTSHSNASGECLGEFTFKLFSLSLFRTLDLPAAGYSMVSQVHKFISADERFLIFQIFHIFLFLTSSCNFIEVFFIILCYIVISLQLHCQGLPLVKKCREKENWSGRRQMFLPKSVGKN